MRIIGLGMIAAALLALSVVRTPARATTSVFEAESYAEIAPPFRVAHGDSASSGATWVELPKGSGQGWRGLGTGSVTYRVDTAAGDYTIWVRTLWGDGCTNALFMRVNDNQRVVFGNDAIFGLWHWVKAVPQHFKDGINFIEFSNHSDGVALDKLVVTNDPLYLPEGLGQGITRFFDGFAGCDADNTGSWEFVSGNWRAVPAVGDSAAGVNNCLAQWSGSGGIALAGYSSWRDYTMEVKLMFSGPGAAGLIVGHQDNQHEYRLVWELSEEHSRLSLQQITNGRSVILAETKDLSGKFDHWYTLGLRRNGGTWQAVIDGKPVLDCASVEGFQGQIGLVTENSGGTYFDNVDVRFSNP